MSEKPNKLSGLVDIPGLEPEDARRRRLLNVMLLAMAASAVVTLVALLIAAPLGVAGGEREVRLLGLSVVVALLGVGTIYALNRYVSGELASTLFLLLLIAIAAFSDEPQEVVDGRGLLVFAIPILAASVLLRPWASFAAAGACALVVVVIGLAVGQQSIPNVPAILGFFMLALVSWLSARSLKYALEKLRASNELLQESEERYRTLFESLPVGLFRSTPAGRFVEANPAHVQLLGCPDLETLLATPVADFYVEPEGRQQWKAVTERGGITQAWEVEWRRLDGTPIWVQEHARAVRDDEGQVMYYDGVAVDITERVWAEEERARLAAQVREQARRMEQILTTVPTGVLLLDAEGRVLQANPVAEKDLAVLAGAGIGDILTRLGDHPLAELLTSPPTRGLWHEVKANGRTFEVIARPVEPALSVPGGNGAGPEYWVLVTNDVTREREVQAQLQQQERLAAVGQLAAGIAHDFNNIMTTVILSAQMAARSEALSERDREGMAVINQQARHATRLIEQILDFSRRAMLERRPLDLLLLLKEQVGLLERTLPEHVEIELRYGHGKYMVDADPTRMQQMITNLAVNARDAMPGGGELRFELSRVEVTGEGLPWEAGRPPLSSPPQAGGIEGEDSPPQAGGTETGTSPPQAGGIEGGASTPHATEPSPPHAGGIEGEDSPPQAGGTETGTSPPLAGGIEAGTSTPLAGGIEAGTSPPLAGGIEGGPEEGQWIRLTVSDTGTGIPPEVLPHIFEPFFTTKGPGEGSGLGLAQVHGIVGQHGGRIDVQTQAGEGTTFTIYLPALGGQPAGPSLPDVPAALQGEGEVVLVVEDGEAVRAALVAGLEQLNYRTLEAANGLEAVAVMEERGEQVGLVLSDVVMPGMGGKALFHALRERGWRTPVVLLTGHSMERELDELRERGLAAWLPKPPSLERLAQAVADALRDSPRQG